MTILLSWLNSAYETILPFVLLLGVLIFFHELGHFLVAKWCGVRVEVFSLGFGKKLLKLKRGDTTYCLSLIPLGGYVKMFGDEINSEITPELRPVAFTHKKVWQRIAIVVAGPLMNFLIAIVIFAIIASIGEEYRKPILGDVVAGTPAAAAGFQSGDEVLAVNHETVTLWDQFETELTKSLGHKAEIQIRRGEQNLTLAAEPQPKANPNPMGMNPLIGEVDGLSWQSRAAVVGVRTHSPAAVAGLKTGDQITNIDGHELKYYRDLDKAFLGLANKTVRISVDRLTGDGPLEKREVKTLSFEIAVKTEKAAELGLDSGDLYLAKVLEKSPAAAAGLQEGDRIVQVGKLQPSQWDDILNTVKSFAGDGQLHLAIERDSASGPRRMEFDITPTMTAHMTPQGTEEKRYTVGIMPWIQNAPPALTTVVAAGLFPALSRGFVRTGEFTAMMSVSFLRMFKGQVSAKNIGGVLAIGQAAKETWKSGISHFLHLMALISVNLGILNLLPIPVLDGGHLVFYSIEWLKGTPLSMRKMEIAQQVGLVLLMSLMAFSFFNDVNRFLGWW